MNESIPTLPRPVGSLFSNGIAKLGNVSDYLRAVPGKKVLLWFAGSFPLYLDPALCTVMPNAVAVPVLGTPAGGITSTQTAAR